MRAPITLSLHLPNFNYPGVEPDGLFEHLASIAGTAEDSGFSSITVMDHLHQIRGIGPRTNFMLEGNTILAGLAARTSRVSVGLLVGGVTYRNPALFAKATTTLDIISRGRAIFGIGAAWFEEEHDAYGFGFPPLKERFERLEEALQITRLMFTEEESSFEGRHYRTHNVLNNPRPLRGDIPIMIGGSGERKTLRMVAQYADACNLFGDVERVQHLLGVLERHCETLGRDGAEITKTKMSQVYIGATHEAGQAKLDAALAAGMPPERVAMALVGDPGEVAEQAHAFVEVGIEGLTLSIPDVHDLDVVRIAGESLSPVFGSPAP
jgi:F420-dependent oxidoreductase-like protein